jgi:hypothetical protein
MIQSIPLPRSRRRGRIEGFDLAEADLIEHTEHGDEAPKRSFATARVRRPRQTTSTATTMPRRTRRRSGLVDRRGDQLGSLQLGGVPAPGTLSSAHGRRSRMRSAIAGTCRSPRSASPAVDRAGAQRLHTPVPSPRQPRGRAACTGGPRTRQPRRAPAQPSKAAASYSVANASMPICSMRLARASSARLPGALGPS